MNKILLLFISFSLITISGCDRGLDGNEPLEITPALTSVDIIKNIEYGRVGVRSLLLDIYRPKQPIMTPMPVVIYIHGGGWRGGDKFPSRVQYLAQYGFFCVSINYRLSGEATFPAAVEDSKCAVRWLKAHALTYGIDPERIGVWGGSAGGHLSLMVACADESAGLEGSGGWQQYSSRVRAACSYWGPTDFVSWFENKSPGGDEGSAEVQFLGGSYSEIPEIYRLASPISHIAGDDPPLLLVHDELDPVVPYSQSQLMYQAYIEMGLRAELIKITGAGHGFKQIAQQPISPSREEVEQEVLDFFLKELVNTGQ